VSVLALCLVVWHSGNSTGHVNQVTLHCVSKNVPPLQLALMFTYTVRLRQFWHKCYRESRQSKLTLFSHLT